MKNVTGDVSRQILTRLSLDIDMPAIFFRSLPKYYKQVGHLLRVSSAVLPEGS